MAAAAYSFTIKEGDSFSRRIRWTDSSGAPIDLSGASAKMQIRETDYAGSVLIELSTDNGRITIPEDGVIELAISATDTGALDFDEAVHDLQITLPGGVVTTILEGKVALNRDVTR